MNDTRRSALVPRPRFLAGLLVVLVTGPLPAVEPDYKASRPPDAPDCAWRPFASQALGIEMLVEDCGSPASHYEFSATGNRIEQHRPADDITFGGSLVMEIFHKPAEQDIGQAIAEQFIAKLPPEARASCKVEPPDRPRLAKGKVVLTLVPTGPYARKIAAELARTPRDFGCGDYGRSQETTYFEYHPRESRTRFAFVVYGMDEPMFDEESIVFLSGRGP